MEKTGIITFHRADNLGAVLQSYALQQTLENEVGTYSEIIDYKCDAVEDTKRVKKCTCLKDCVKYIPMKLYYFIKHRGFERFRKQRLKLSDKIYTAVNINECLSRYDTFITGSDQVWNFECSGTDKSFFLDFVPSDKKKLSYAASIGQYKYSEKDAIFVRSALKSFNGISVREESAKHLLESLGTDEVEVLPDPVVLLSREQWKDIMPERLCKEKYLLVYIVAGDVNVSRCAEIYAKEHNLKIINNKKSIEFILHNSPAEFLSWVYNAEYVFTNSFHGTAFSLIFNKPLCADIELLSGEINSRVNDFLKRTNAEKCILDKNNLHPEIPNSQNVLEEMKNNAIIYLKSNC